MADIGNNKKRAKKEKKLVYNIKTQNLCVYK